MKTYLLGFVSMLWLTGCGNPPGFGGNPVEVASLNGAEYGLMDKGTIQTTPTSIEGTGSILFRKELPEKDNNFDLDFSLSAGSTLTLLCGATKNLTDAATLTFERLDGDMLGVTFRSGNEFYDLSSDFASMTLTGPLSISVDLHEHGHIVMWVNGEENEYAFSNKWRGKYWGLTLKNARVTKASIGKPKKPH